MRNPFIKVQKITTGETFGADEVVMRRVKLEDTRGNAQHVILFCPIISRVGSDVEAALKRVAYGQRVILVLMHHTRDADYSTAGGKWSDYIENVDLDVDILYHESVPGLLTCAQNDKAVLQIQSFLAPNQNNSDSNRDLDFWHSMRLWYWSLHLDRTWVRLWYWFWHSDRTWMRLWYWSLHSDRTWMRLWHWSLHSDRTWMRLWYWFWHSDRLWMRLWYRFWHSDRP